MKREVAELGSHSVLGYPSLQLVLWTLSLGLCSAQLLKPEQVAEYTSCFTALARSPTP